MNLNVVFSLDPQLLALAMTFSLDYAHRLTALEESMSELSDALADLDLSTDRAVQRVTAESDKLHAQMATLQALVDSQGATPEVLAKIKFIQAKIDAVDATNPATLPGTPDPAPAPAAAASSKPGKH